MDLVGGKGWEVDRTGSVSCPVVGFGISSVEPLYSGMGELDT
jgi:hypothetical protein